MVSNSIVIETINYFKRKDKKMYLKLKGRIWNIYEGDKSNYVSFNDVESQGQIKLGLPKNVQVKNDQLVELEAEVKPGLGKSGLFLQVTKIIKRGE